jgi:hypothetical protein
MDKALKIPDDQYHQWIADLSKRSQQALSEKPDQGRNFCKQ